MYSPFEGFTIVQQVIIITCFGLSLMFVLVASWLAFQEWRESRLAEGQYSYYWVYMILGGVLAGTMAVCGLITIALSAIPGGEQPELPALLLTAAGAVVWVVTMVIRQGKLVLLGFGAFALSVFSTLIILIF